MRDLNSEGPRLTSLSHGGGCGCKLGPSELAAVVAKLPKPALPNLLVGVEHSDDAAVFQVSPELAVVSTLDFFMPLVDDPRDFGRIAAANAISDVYAMGGTPQFALAILGFPVGRLSAEVAAEILAGGAEVAAAAGIAIVGGHTIDDSEPKFGLAVTGLVHPDRVWRNSTAREGDLLVLTKALGVGCHGSAVKKGLLDQAGYDALIRTTTTLNRAAAEVGQAYWPSAVTDVTGFGLLGHALEMARGSDLSVELNVGSLPLLAQTRALLEAGVVPGATARVLAHAEPYCAWGEGVSAIDRLVIADPQTSGGLLFAIPEARCVDFVRALRAAGCLAAAVVGRVGGKRERAVYVGV